MRIDQEDRAGRRFLQNLEQCIGCGCVQVIGAVHHAHPPAAIRRRRGKHVQRTPHGLDRDHRGSGLLVGCGLPAQHDEIGVRQIADQPRGLPRRIDIQSVSGWRRAALEAEQLLGYHVGESCLADPFRAADQPGVMQLALSQPLKDGGLGIVVPDEVRGLTRMGKACQPVRFIPGFIAHDSAPAASACCSSRASTADHARSSTAGGSRLASTTTQRAGSRSAMSRYARRSRV